MSDKQKTPQEPDEQKSKVAPREVIEKEPKNSPEQRGSQVADINPPSAPPGHRDREQI